MFHTYNLRYISETYLIIKGSLSFKMAGSIKHMYGSRASRKTFIKIGNSEVGQLIGTHRHE